jgi:hypothetical protein
MDDLFLFLSGFFGFIALFCYLLLIIISNKHVNDEF